MKLIKPSFEIIPQGYNIEDIYEHIERCGRVCYKSEGNIKYDECGNSLSADPFVQRLIKSGHLSVLEHGTVYLKAKTEYTNTFINPEGGEDEPYNPLYKYYRNNYSYVVDSCDYVFVTSNLRVLIENNWMNDLKYLCSPTEYHEKRTTVKFICDRGVLQEFRTHRVFSKDDDDNYTCDTGYFSAHAESTRYCNYSKDKFNNELTYIIPCWTDLKEGWYGYQVASKYTSIDESYLYSDKPILNEEDASNATVIKDNNIPLISALTQCEVDYFRLINSGWVPQQARTVLPNSLKTELVMTGFMFDWKHFFSLRSNKYGRGGAHPQADELATPLYEEFVKEGLLNETESLK